MPPSVYPDFIMPSDIAGGFVRNGGCFRKCPCRDGRLPRSISGSTAGGLIATQPLGHTASLSRIRNPGGVLKPRYHLLPPPGECSRAGFAQFKNTPTPQIIGAGLIALPVLSVQSQPSAAGYA